MHGPFHFPFRPATVRPAQDGLEPVNPREVLKLPVQCGVLFHVVIITEFDERLWLTTLARRHHTAMGGWCSLFEMALRKRADTDKTH